MANTKGKNTKRKTKAAQKQAAKCQLYSVIGFAVAVFILCVVFIKGENVWLMLHNFTFGVFGVTAYAVPFFIGILSIVLALEKMTNNALAKLIEGGALIALLGAAVDIFSKHSPNISFWAHLGNAYLSGTHLKSGGFLGALIGHPIYLLFGKTGAAITVILIMVVLLMVMTGTTLLSIIRAVKKPAKAVAEHVENAYQKNQSEKEIKVVKGFNVDIPVDGSIKERQKEQNELPLKSRRLVRAYKDEPQEDTSIEEIKTSLPDGERSAAPQRRQCGQRPASGRPGSASCHYLHLPLDSRQRQN